MNNDSMPLYPQVYPSAQIQRKENTSSPLGPSPTLSAAVPQLLGPENTPTICPLCHASVKTAVKYSVTSRTHIAAALWCLICCLCCVPYGSDSAKNTDHYCPSCQRYIGTYQK